MKKKLQRIFSMVLAISMIMSLLSLNTIAAGENMNPTYTVEYYANLEMIKLSDSGTLPVINTSGKKLPVNGTTPALKYLTLNSNNTVQTTTKLTQIFKNETFNFAEAPGLDYCDQVSKASGNYKLTGVQVKGKNYPVTAKFTNNPKAASDSVIYIEDGAVIRLIYTPGSGTVKQNTTFFDYDISDGKVYTDKSFGDTKGRTGVMYVKTYKQGINSDSNYSGTGIKYAFGNANAGTGLGMQLWNGNRLNAANGSSYGNGYQYCTFGLVKDITNVTGDYVPSFASGVSAPTALFSNQNFKGQTVINGWNLGFTQKGDTYTLSTVNNGSKNVLVSLNQLPKVHSNGIYSNEFWPMDSVNNTDGHDIQFGLASVKNNRKYVVSSEEFGQLKHDDKTIAAGNAAFLPISDKDGDHNSYFGMKSQINFSITEDYVGPLEYLFFGDDDMWVFLTNKSTGKSQLIVDIGGVHSSVGQYVNLWDYVKKGTAGDYTLTFFYTERGASGSTCYMQFTLPTVNQIPPVATKASLRLDKTVVDASNTHNGANDTYSFTVNLKNADGSAYTDFCVCKKFAANGTELNSTLVSTGSVDVALAHGEYIEIDHLLTGTKYEITEAAVADCECCTGVETTATGTYDTATRTATGTMSKAQKYAVSYTNTFTPKETSVSVTKVWNDADNQDGKRPGSVTVNLLANGSATGKTATLSEANQWTYTFTGLLQYNNGQEIRYTVTEDAVSGYQLTGITGSMADGYTVTNSHTPETVSVSGAKTWNDNGDQDGVRPESITINLLADGEKVDSKTVTAKNGWAWSFTGLPKYKVGAVGHEITYTITEEIVEGYTTVVSGYNVTNSYTPGKTGVSVTKIWADGDNQDGLRPTEISVQLYADGKEQGAPVTLNDANGWTYTWTNLDLKKAGKAIEYTVDETAVPEGYTKSIGGEDNIYTITNTHATETTEISVAKVWDDANNQDGARPASVTVKLLADGQATDWSVTLNKENQWTATFTGLPAKAGGRDIEYTVAEVEVPTGYTSAITGSAAAGFTVTNSYTPVAIGVSGQKIWADNNNQDGLRPESIVVILNANGEEVARKTVTAADEWNFAFTDLPAYANGQAITYTVVEENVPDGYTMTPGTKENDYQLTNTHTPATVSVEGRKIWNDGNDQDGKRPASITIRLMNGAAEVASKTVTAADGWAWSFTDLPKYANGQEITYTISEDAVTGYGTTVNGYDVTNSYTPAKTSVSVAKVWEDAGDQDGKRPASITVQLLADGQAYGQAVTLKADNRWSHIWNNLPKNAAGKAIEYTVAEVAVPDGYTSEITGSASAGYVITNSYTPETTEVSGSKTWNDADNQDGKRPESITVNLLAGGTKVDAQTVTAANGWKYSFTDLPKYANGKAIVYTITEEPVAGYTAKVDGYDVTNTHTPETVDVSGSKTWNDANDQDGKRPASITINLLADGVEIDEKTVTAKNGWAWSFTGLPKYSAGTEIVYTITEDAVAEYATTVNGYDVINSYTPGKTSVTVTKVWDDANDQDGKRPDSIAVQLYANGQKLGDAVTLNADNRWTYTWTGLDEKAAGRTIAYTVDEVEVPAGYTKDITGDAAVGYTITNSHVPETTGVSGSKTWNDANDQDGKRPASITINLLANGEQIDSKTVTAKNGWAWNFTDLPKYADGQEIAYTITEDTVEGYTTTVSGYDVTNSYTPGKTGVSVTKVWADGSDQDGIRPAEISVQLYADGKELGEAVVLNAANGWTYTWTDLDLKKAGQTIAYTVDEIAVPEGYTKSITGDASTGFTITNTHATETTEVSVIKVWEDFDNQDGKRPDSVTVKLLADGQATDKAVTLNAANGWKASFTDLPAKANGKAIVYTVTEADVPSGYTSAVTGDAAAGFTVTNSYTPAATEISGRKVWDDNGDQDGLRPEKVTIILKANGVEVQRQDINQELDNWTFKFEDLPSYANGQRIAYTVDEVDVPGYTKNITGTTITNTHVPATVSVEGRKTWSDANDQDGKRPESITIRLLADSVQVASKTVTADDGWAWSFSELPKFKNVNGEGVEIAYSISEDAVVGYSVSVNGYDVTNSHTPEIVSVEGRKIWNDANDQDGKRPESITIRLLADGVEVDSASVTAANGWAWNFTGLPKYSAGTEITYTITEDAVADYSTVVNGYDVTNSYTPGKTSVTVTKVWDDDNDYDGIRPEEITVKLLANGVEVEGKSVILNDANNWTYTWTDLDEKAAGQTIAYTVSEVEVKGYETEIAGDATVGYTITNTHEPTYYQEDVVSVRKVWDDNGNAAGARPASVTVQLKDSAGAVHATAVLNAANGWSAIWYVPAGSLWYVEELDVPAGYASRVTSPNGLDFTVTNIYEIEIIEEEPPLIDLEDDDVPMIDAPKTSDPLTMMAAVSALSGAGLFLTRKKREEEE